MREEIFEIMGFIGGGNMGEALICGLLESKRLPSQNILVFDKKDQRLHYLIERYGIKGSESISELSKEADIIIIAVKPQDVFEVASEVGEVEKLILLATPRIKLAQMEKLMRKARIIRFMPNILCEVLKGTFPIVYSDKVTPEDRVKVEDLLSCIGNVYHTTEAELDALTILNSCSPAMIATIIEVLADAGIEIGIPNDLAYQVVLEVISGTCEYLKRYQPRQLRLRVSSPGGLTVAMLHDFESAGLRRIILDVIKNAYKRLG